MAAGPPAICCRGRGDGLWPRRLWGQSPALRFCRSVGAKHDLWPHRSEGQRSSFGERGLGLNAAAEGRIQGTTGSLAEILKGQRPLSMSGQSPERVRAEPGVTPAARGIQAIAWQCVPRLHRLHTAGRARRVLEWEAPGLPIPKEQTDASLYHAQTLRLN